MSYLAKSLDKLRSQVNAAHPNRSKLSDGWIADARHMAGGRSDHIPNSAGAVTAIDITHDPINGLDARKLAETLVASRDPRIKYIISNGQIVSAKVSPWQWRKYSGSNGHFHHVHISVDPSPSLYDDARGWDLSAGAPVADEFPRLSRGMTGSQVKYLQTKLNNHGFKLDVDGDFGPSTERAVRAFQNANGIPADGIAGGTTWQKL